MLPSATAGVPHHHHQHQADGAAEAGPALFNLFRTYVPRQECMFHEHDVIWTHAISDAFITLAYFSIPVALIYFYRRREDLAFNWIFVLFATFIFACGLTHLFQVFAIWQPLYRLEGLVKILTAMVSVATAAVLWPLIPKALALPSPAMLRAANIALEEEVENRRQAQEELRRLSHALEARVQQRTAELERTNADLAAEIEERKRVELERQGLLASERAARAEAERLTRLKDEFLATLSHELRTPLNAIIGWAHLMKSGRLPKEECDQAIEVIDRNARAQTRLIADLLDMSRIVSGKLRLEVRHLNLAPVILAAIDTVRSAADAKSIRMETDLDESSGVISGDPDRLQQVMWNLLTNAIKFTPRQGWVRVSLRRAGDEVEVQVADNGEGVPPEAIGIIFERFRQADQRTSRAHGGLGLGLAIVRHIVELHGGTAEAHSDGLGRGSTFTVRLPLVPGYIDGRFEDETLDRAALDAETAAIDLTGTSVLVVDDEPDAATIVQRLLSEHGARVRVAHSAPEALREIEHEAPDVLISDIGMPEMDGYDLIRRVRQRAPEQGGRMPAIALTAFARPEDASRAASVGYQTHIAKPLDANALISAVHVLSQERRRGG